MRSLLFITFLFFASIPLEAGEIRLSDLDREIIEFFETEHFDAPDYPDLESLHNKLRWYWGLGQKARPALMYLLTEKYDGNLENMKRAIDALSAMDGDRSDVLNHVRTNLPGMIDSEEIYEKSNYINSCLGALGRHGSPEDMDLIRTFLDYQDYIVKTMAENQLIHIQQRIDAGEFDEPKTRREPGSGALDENNEKPSESVSGADDDEKPAKNEESDSTTGWALAALVGLLAMVLLGWWRLRIARRSNNQ